MTMRIMIKTALKVLMASGFTSNRSRVLLSTSMVYAPIIEPVMLNLPPANEFPPKATARIASIMINLSRLTLSWRPTLFTAMKPATALQTPMIKKVKKIIFLGLIPFSLAALGLTPTAST